MQLDARIRVIIVDASRFRSSLLKKLLNKAGARFELVGEASDIAIAIKLAAVIQPDVALVAADIARNERAFRKFASEQGVSVLILGDGHGDREEVAILRGALGVVYADDIADSLFDAIEAVHEEHLWLNRRAAGRVFVGLCRQYAERRRIAMR